VLFLGVIFDTEVLFMCHLIHTVCPNKSDNTKLLALVSANLHRIAHN